MMIVTLGISHQSAPVSVRGIYSFDEPAKINFRNQIREKLGIEGLVIISTCNRTEIYFNTMLSDPNVVRQGIMLELFRFRNSPEEHLQYFYFYNGDKAVEQLMKVASGLESLILGEEQILVQVKEAFRMAQTARMTDCIISRLFIKAIEAGKRVRTETSLNKGAASVSYATVDLCLDLFEDLETRKILVIGAGQTGELFLQCLLRKAGIAFIIANRTLAKAEIIATKYSGTPIELSEISTWLPQCDIVVAATSAGEHIISKQDAINSMNERGGAKQVYIDLAVPSNIAKDVTDAGNVEYYSVDDLQQVIMKNVAKRRLAVDHSMQIIGEVSLDFKEWLDMQNLIPTIITIKENLKNIHQTELEGFIRYRKIKEQDLIEQYSEHISEKYTEVFIRRLKQVTDNGRRPEYLKIINDLFGEN